MKTLKVLSIGKIELSNVKKSLLKKSYSSVKKSFILSYANNSSGMEAKRRGKS
jgi:hypothetical protein